MAINPDSFFVLVLDYSLMFDKLTYVDHIITQTHNPLKHLLFCFSPRYQLFNTQLVLFLKKKSLFFVK